MDQGAHVVAVIDLLLTIGYVDGTLQADEEAFIRAYIDRVVAHVAKSPDDIAAWRTRVDSAYTRLRDEIGALAAEVTAADDDGFLRSRLKLRAVTLFRAFPPADQKVALELLAAVTQTDGVISPDEAALHEELLAHFHAPADVPALGGEARASIPQAQLMRLDEPRTLTATVRSHPMLDALEHPYPRDYAQRQQHLAADYELAFQAIGAWERMRARGNGRLTGVTDIEQLPRGTRMLDDRTYVLRPDAPTDLIVLGDLHGCYSCLKAALLQSSFFERVERYQRDPANASDVKLVLLGDYIDRGRFGFEGVTRAALQLLVRYPDHVIMLRGNHELLTRMGPGIVSMVQPAESTPQLAEIAPLEILEAYKHLFDAMPTACLAERILLVHGGIPRDDTIAERFVDLSSLNDPIVQFEMLWSDPADTDVVPLALQHESARFAFGRDQARTFMDRIGCHTLIRGHEQVEAGFATNFKLPMHRLYTLFSAGGAENSDLPEESRYRRVTPMALSIQLSPDGTSVATPWRIDYAPFVRHGFA